MRKLYSNSIRPILRHFLTDYAAAISIVLFSGASYLPILGNLDIARLAVPSEFGTSSGRPLVVDFIQGSNLVHVFSAIIPAFFLTLLFYFDHNVSSLLSQRSEYHLKKPASYNWDFLVIGLILIACGIFAIPPCNGLIPQAPMHVQALAKQERKGPHRILVYSDVVEQRVSNLAQSLLIAITLTPVLLSVISSIPISVLDGLFLFIGFSSFQGNQLFEVCFLLLIILAVNADIHSTKEQSLCMPTRVCDTRPIPIYPRLHSIPIRTSWSYIRNHTISRCDHLSSLYRRIDTHTKDSIKAVVWRGRCWDVGR